MFGAEGNLSLTPKLSTKRLIEVVLTQNVQETLENNSRIYLQRSCFVFQEFLKLLKTSKDFLNIIHSRVNIYKTKITQTVKV